MTRKTTVLALALALACLFCVAACGDKKKKQAGKNNRSYDTRGQVESTKGKDGTMFIRHEAIAEFVTSAGKKMKMDSMSMGFFVGDVKVDGIAAGDKVAFTFRTDWNLKPALRLVKISKLPAETELKLGGMGHGKH